MNKNEVFNYYYLWYNRHNINHVPIGIVNIGFVVITYYITRKSIYVHKSHYLKQTRFDECQVSKNCIVPTNIISSKVINV